MCIRDRLIFDFISWIKFEHGINNIVYLIADNVILIILTILLFRSFTSIGNRIKNYTSVVFLTTIIVTIIVAFFYSDYGTIYRYVTYFVNLSILITSLIYLYDFAFNFEEGNTHTAFPLDIFIVMALFLSNAIYTYISLSKLMNIQFEIDNFWMIRQGAYFLFNMSIALIFIWQYKLQKA